MIPHVIYRKRNFIIRDPRHRINWGVKNKTSTITQPPMLAYAVEKIYSKTKDRKREGKW